MTEQKIGAQLDELGLTAELEEGHRIVEAKVELTTEPGPHSEWGYLSAVVAQAPRRDTPVPHPVERRIVTVIGEGQEISEEQRERVGRWLTANGIDPKRVTRQGIRIESNVRGDRDGSHIIGFTEYYETADGHRIANEKTKNEALTYERWVRQTVELEPDPTWEGWPSWQARVDTERAADA